MSKAKIANFLIDHHVKVNFVDSDDLIDFRVDYYLDELINFGYEFDQDDIISILENSEDEEPYIQLLEYAKKNKRDDFIHVILEEAFGDVRYWSNKDNLFNLIEYIIKDKKLAKIVVNEFLSESDIEYLKRYDSETVDKLLVIADEDYWYNQLKSERLSTREFRESISEILENIPLEKLYELKETIAKYIDHIGSGYMNKRYMQQSVMEKIYDKYPDLLYEILETGEVYDWSSEDFDFAKIEKEVRQEDRRTNRISVEEANQIIKDEGLDNILEAREGYIGLEDMKFDYLYDKKKHMQISEKEGNEPWFYGRTFGDKQMPKDWFMKIIKKYKERL